ncbi:MAG: hypothetical protein LKF30_05615 [Sphingobium sp.]|jgi:hypothetical protein|nr:hypothetical protein [Sphingobium sp.]MCI1757342.1 hypothetical protein [Sphingobium sp.]MCI2053174.1 hypothetical protein [Sphingobium sp.]
MKPLLSANVVIAKWRCDPAFTAAYDALEEEFALAVQTISTEPSRLLNEDIEQ